MKRKNLPLALAVLLLPPAMFFGLSLAREKTRRIPEKRLWFQTLDTTNFFKTPRGAPVGYPAKNSGTATLVCEKFLLRFEGETFNPGDGIIGGGYQVDGRYGGFFPPDSQPFVNQENNGVTYAYNSGERVLRINFKKYRLNYRDFENTLEVNGRKYATAPEFLVVTIGKDGRIKREKLPSEIVIADVVKDSRTHDLWPFAPSGNGQ